MNVENKMNFWVLQGLKSVVVLNKGLIISYLMHCQVVQTHDLQAGRQIQDPITRQASNCPRNSNGLMYVPQNRSTGREID